MRPRIPSRQSGPFVPGIPAQRDTTHANRIVIACSLGSAMFRISSRSFPETGRSQGPLWRTLHEQRVNCGRGRFARGVPDTQRPSPVPPMRIGKNEGSRPSPPRCDSGGRIPRHGLDPSTARLAERGGRCAEASGAEIPIAGLFGRMPTHRFSCVDVWCSLRHLPAPLAKPLADPLVAVFVMGNDQR